MAKRKILIAEDEEQLLELMAKVVSHAGYEVVLARDGKEAWRQICETSPDIIILDLILPERHGLDLLKALRENPPSEKWQPVIIVSAMDELNDMVRGYAMEADHYLTKPCMMDDLLKGIRFMEALLPKTC